MWGDLVRSLGRYPTVVLTVLDGAGYPFSIRCVPRPDAVRQVLVIDVPDYVDAQPGPAGLLGHAHDDNLWNMTNVVAYGELQRDDDGWLFRARRLVEGAAPRNRLRTQLRPRVSAERYVEKRGIEWPEVPWDRLHTIYEEARTMSTGHTAELDTRDMVVVHTAFRREFRLAPALVRGVAEGDVRRAGVVADHLDLMTTMLYHHHETEDRLLWPVLLERVPAELAPTVELMERQHERIHAANAAVTERLPRWRAGAPAEAGERLAQALDEVDAALAEHLTAEEDQLLPIAARHMTATEWQRMGEEGMAGIRSSQLPLAFGMLQYEGDPEVLAEMLSHAPALARLLMPLMAPRAFARYAKRVHGTSTPARST